MTSLDFEDIQRLQRLGPGSLEHLPPYARDSAIAAILHVKQLEESRLLREGLYYVVLTDLCGATKASAKLGKEANKDRVQLFVQTTIEALVDTGVSNSALFVKDIGDASLFIFSSLSDVLSWFQVLQRALVHVNERFARQADHALWELQAKTVVHLGEVAFSDKRDPVAMAVNHIFKIEKSFGPGELGCTDLVRAAGLPVLTHFNVALEDAGSFALQEHEPATQLWRLKLPPLPNKRL